MSEVFVSYSRKNSDFVHKLDAALTAAQRDVWVDWQDIARGEDWWRSIQTGIDSADTALIVVTENWLVSEVCHRELDYIRQQNKRVFPIILQKIEGDVALRVKGTWVDQAWEDQARANWKYLRSLNWLFFDDESTFDSVLKDLIVALDTDQVYVKGHTRYLVRALEWQQSKANPSFLLEGDQLEAARTWLTSSTGKHPEPLPVHHEYVTVSHVADVARATREKSREQLIRQSRRATWILGAAVVLAIGVALVVGQQFISARQAVTQAAATLQQVNMQVTDAINQQVTAVAQVQAAEAQVATATVEQGNAILAQQTSAAREQSASTRVAVAGATLSPVAPTLAAVASAIANAQMEQEIALNIADASIQMGDNQPAVALQIIDALVEQYPDEALAHMGRGLVLDSLHKPEDAIAAYTRAIEIDPQNVQSYNNRASVYQDMGNDAAAIDDFTRAIEIDPTFTTTYFNRGAAYYTIGNTDLALADFTAAINIDPENVDAYVARGLIYYDVGNFEAALADYNTALTLDPENVDGLSNRGLLYGDQDNRDAALADFNKVIALAPQNVNGYYNRANLYSLEDKTDEALADYAQAIAIDPQNVEAHTNRALLYDQLGQVADAAADYWQLVSFKTTTTTTDEPVGKGQTPFTTTVTMTSGLAYIIPFEGEAGQLLQVTAAKQVDTVDPLLVLLAPDNTPLIANDDRSGSDYNATFTDYALPVDGKYMLVVTYGDVGAEGDIIVTLDLKPAP